MTFYSHLGENKGSRYLLSDIGRALLASILLFTNAGQPEVLPPAIIHQLSPAPAESKSLPTERSLEPDAQGSYTERVLARLKQSAARESDVWLQDDYRQAYVCVSLAERGNPIPFIESSYICLGLHPAKVWPAILARREALLGREAVPSPVKKPVQSVRLNSKEGVA
jgi:hypothetical protein